MNAFCRIDILALGAFPQPGALATHLAFHCNRAEMWYLLWGKITGVKMPPALWSVRPWEWGPGWFLQQVCAQRQLFPASPGNSRVVLVSPTNVFPALQKEKLTPDHSPFLFPLFSCHQLGVINSFQVGTVRKALASDSQVGLAGAGRERHVFVCHARWMVF